MPSSVTVDMKGAIEKSRASLMLPKAAKKQATSWAASSVTALMRSAKSLQKTGGGVGKTGHLANNIGFTVSANDESWEIVVGTGVGGKASVKYARIQDKGGIIKPKKGKYLTIPFPGFRGTSARSHAGSFVIKSKAGNLIIAKSAGKNKIQPMYLLKKEVTLPPTHWFTQVMSYDRKNALSEAMRPEAIMAKAQSMVK